MIALRTIALGMKCDGTFRRRVVRQCRRHGALRTLALGTTTITLVAAVSCGSVEDRTLTDAIAGTSHGRNAGLGGGAVAGIAATSGLGGTREGSGGGGIGVGGAGTGASAGREPASAGSGTGVGGNGGSGLTSGGAGDVGSLGGEAGSEAGAGPGTCKPGDEKLCSAVDSTVLGNCALGHMTCDTLGHWRACDVQPKVSDSCDVQGDDANCDGTPNGGCPCIVGATEHCGPPAEQGICKFGTATCGEAGWGACDGAVLATTRDCASPNDNDCDGKPDDSIDTSCQCPVGTMQACNTHPGHDGVGLCKAGSQTCVVGNSGASSAWGSCSGDVAPSPEACDTAMEDENCNGQSNEGCACVNGQTAKCGNCNGGTQVCASGMWGSCQSNPGLPVTYYIDADGDGYGSTSSTKVSCVGAPSGYTANSTDCCDADRNSYPGAAGWHTAANGCGKWDWDCDNTVVHQYPVIGCYPDGYGDCTCTSSEPAPPFYDGDPGCGNGGVLYAGFANVIQGQDPRTQTLYCEGTDSTGSEPQGCR